MSGKAAKATRRQIRRAVGPEGLEAINALALTVHQHILPQLQAHGELLVSLQRQLNAQQTPATPPVTP